jgi:hypothetical protein
LINFEQSACRVIVIFLVVDAPSGWKAAGDGPAGAGRIELSERKTCCRRQLGISLVMPVLLR